MTISLVGEVTSQTALCASASYGSTAGQSLELWPYPHTMDIAAVSVITSGVVGVAGLGTGIWSARMAARTAIVAGVAAPLESLPGAATPG